MDILTATKYDNLVNGIGGLKTNGLAMTGSALAMEAEVQLPTKA